MSIRLKLAASLLSFTATILLAQAPKRMFVEVQSGVHLEVTDWGGSGRPVVLLAGLGDSAHVYDKLAPKLTNANHLYGITRRGFGSSSAPKSGYSAERLADDVLTVLDALKLNRPVLVGHSVSGEELSAIGARRSDRIAGLIYLDAAWDRTYLPPKANQDREKEDKDRYAKVGIPEQPKPDPGRFDPAAEVRAGVQKPNYEQIRVPALAIYAAARSWQELMPGSPEITDPDKRKAADQVVADLARIRKHMADEFRSGVANSRVVEIPGAGHYVFRTNEADVIREIRGFLDSLE